MLGIENIASYVPVNRISNLTPERLAAFEIDERFVRTKIGVSSRALKAADEDTSDLATKALQLLLKKTGLAPEAIDALVVVTQNPDTNLPHTAALVHGKAGLAENCAAFDVGLGCSGYVYGLSILSAFLSANGLMRGVLVTADPYSKIIDPEDKSTALLFGDAATATLIGPDPIFSLSTFSFGTIGKQHQALECKDGRLSMNGREVFNFAATYVAPDVEKVLERAGLAKGDIDAFIFHQGSRYILDTIRARLSVPVEKVRIGLEDYGNTISSSIPLLLEKELGREDVNTLLLSGFGVGLSWATCVCKRKV